MLAADKHFYNVYSQGYNQAFADGHAKFTRAVGKDAFAALGKNGQFLGLSSVRVDPTDTLTGCNYFEPLSPFREGNL